MTKWIKDKWKKFTGWCKRTWTKILIGLGIIGVAVAAGIGAPIDAPDFLSVQNGETIEFQNCKMVENDGIDVCSDKHDYGAWDEVTNYLRAENKTGYKRNAKFSPGVRKSEFVILSATRLEKDVEYEYEVPVYEEQCRTIEGETATGTYSNESCIDVQVGTEIATSTKNVWKPIGLLGKVPNQATEHWNNKEFFKSNSFNALLDDGEIAIFRVVLRVPPREKDEPYLWIVKYPGGKTILDPTISSAWEGRYKIEPRAASTTGTHTNYPIFYDGDEAPAECIAVMQADGDDIRFTLSDVVGSELLSHEKVSATTTVGVWEYYVNVPSYSFSTDIYVWCGNDAASDISTTTTWNSNYKLVNHGADANDSTVNANNGTDTGTIADYGSPKIGKARVYDTGEKTLFTGYAPTINNSVTISGWVNFDTFPGAFTHGTLAIYGANDGFALDINYPQVIGDFQSRINDVGEISNVLTWSTTHPADTWHYEVCAYDTGEQEGYFNGVSEGTVAKTVQPGSGSTGFGINIRENGNASEQVVVRYDEVRVYAGDLSDNLISMEYAMQNSPSTYWSAGAWEPTAVPAAVAPTGNQPNYW